MREFLRLFISVDFSEDIKGTLYEAAMELKKHSIKGRITNRENFHLTLAFIGETKRLEEVISAIEETAVMSYLSPFYLYTKGVGRFKGGDGDIYWVGVEENEMLMRLNEALVKALISREFQVEERAYNPHLTLGRDIVLERTYSLEEFAGIVPDSTIKVDKISLMKSHRVNGKLIYTTLFSKEITENN